MVLNIKKLITAVLVCQMAGVIGSVATAHGLAPWYENLQKPDFTPPGMYIGMVWVFLYTLMGVSLYIIWEKCDEARNNARKKIKFALMIFAVQLALNASWSFLFFTLESPFYGLIGIVMVWLAAVLTIIVFYEIDESAAYLLLPYLLWLTFAGLLNYRIWQLNPVG